MAGHEATLVLIDVHKGACNNHIGGKTLTHKLLIMGYCYPTLTKDSISFIKRRGQCQIHGDLHHSPAELLQSMTLP